jgi:hypothetical protein
LVFNLADSAPPPTQAPTPVQRSTGQPAVAVDPPQTFVQRDASPSFWDPERSQGQAGDSRQAGDAEGKQSTRPSPEELDDLAKRLYPRIRPYLRKDLWLDRERSGRLADLNR